MILKTPNNEIVCLRSRGASSCDWRSFPTQPGPARPGGGHHHRSGARVSRPVVVVVVVLSARVHGLRPPCSWLSCLLCMFTELESNEHSGSQLRPFQQPSAPQLSSPPPHPPPLHPRPVSSTLRWLPEALMCTQQSCGLANRAERPAKAAAAPLFFRPSPLSQPLLSLKA